MGGCIDVVSTVFITFILCRLDYISTQDLLGCGGFVKSDVEINFSKVEVKLYTKQGSLKYSTDCAPNNGYYLIPLDDKGEYQLRVEPPKGWSFEPSSIDLQVDGKNDPCSKGEDINFVFKGFGVTGKVVSKGSSEGPASVNIALKSKDKLYQTVTTQRGGSYVFSNVLPGEYSIEASHPAWLIQSSTTEVKVGRDNGDAGSAIVVHGYDVSGQVFSQGEPIKGVSFVLFSKADTEEVKGCSRTAVQGVIGRSGQKQVCFVLSGQDGSFSFSSLPIGHYSLVPYYKGEQIKFDVLPELIDFDVRHDSVIIKEKFQVTGFSVSGRIVDSHQGRGVSGAVVSLDGKKQTTTDKSGVYHLDKMKTGTYTLRVSATDIFFSDLTVKISPNTPKLPDIVAASFSVCGKVTISTEDVDINEQRTVKYSSRQNKQSSIESASTDRNGLFCLRAKPGTYIFEAVVSEAEKQAGILLAPLERVVTVTNKPIHDITFSQFKAIVNGAIGCLERCSDISISLTSNDRLENVKMAEMYDNDFRIAKFQFTDVLPGRYTVSLVNERWCWKEKSKDINVQDSNVDGVAFTHSGYVLAITSSHHIKLNYKNEGKSRYLGELNVTSGINHHCLSESGRYSLTPVSCHQFEQETYEFDSGKPVPISLTAIKHMTQGTITSTENVKDITVKIRSSSEEEPFQTAKLEPEKSKTNFVYRFTYWSRTGEVFTVEPQSRELLFYPPDVQVTVVGDSCPGVVATFEGRRGVFIEGAVKPVLAGVQIVITGGQNKDIHIETDAKGKYRVGPLHSGGEYGVTADKDGYVITPIKDNRGYFHAFKLGKIAVQVREVQGSPLGNVLLSLSGGQQYRSNNFTHDNGTWVFSSLSPGHYFLRPMMKEYRFEPTSQMIEVKEGTTVNLAVKGTRVAFSCHGAVTSLNGEPEADVLVEAVGLKECSEYQEETKTESDGSYRIRGLLPKCQYNVLVKQDPGNSHIERAYPKLRTIQVKDSDLNDVDIIVFRYINQMDLSGNIVTATEHLPTLKVELYVADNIDSPVQTVSMSNSFIFFLPTVELDNTTVYTVRLSSSLSKSSYDYELMEETFTANTHYKHITFQFNPKRKSVEQELSRGSFMVLPITILLGALGYHYKIVLPFILQAIAYLRSLADKRASRPASSLVESEEDSDPSETMNRNKKKARRA